MVFVTTTIVSLWLAVASVSAQLTADFLLVPDLNAGNIYRLTAATGASSIAVTGEQRPVAIAYDQTLQRIFWTDITVNALKSSNLDGSNETVVYRMSPPSVSDGMAVSAVDQRIFYSDTGANVIGAVNYDGTNQQNLITTDLLEPRAIAVYPDTRTIFFTDWGFTPGRIWRANMDDGSNRVLIVNTAITWPNGLTLDATTNELFWCDSGVGSIETSDFDGQNRRILVSAPGRYFGIGVDSQWVYISSWNSPVINKYPRAGGTNTPTAVSSQTFSQAGAVAVSYL